MADDFNLEDNSDMVLRELDDRMHIALREVGREAEGIAKKLVNQAGAIDTGRLINSITFATDDHFGAHNYNDRIGNSYSQDVNRPPKGTVYIGTNVKYAKYIEYGHHSYAGVHFLKNAAGNYIERYKNIIDRIMKRD